MTRANRPSSDIRKPLVNKADMYEYSSLNPDAFTRFFICKEILKKSFGKTVANILDVGGGSKYFYQSLSLDKLPYKLTVIDILPPEVKNPAYKYVQGDATKMIFKDNNFEAVVSMDVLEHIPDDKKVSFIRECYRVAKDLIIIAGPFDTPETDQAERMANDFFRSMHGRDHPWLIEHFQQNKPKRSMIEAEIKRFGCSYLRFESNALPLWLRLILLNFIPHNLVDGAKIKELNSYYNENMIKLGDFDSPGYRWFYIIYKNPKLKKEFDKYFKLTPSMSSKLIFEQKMTVLFTERLKLDLDAQMVATAFINELTMALKNTTQNANDLRVVLETVQSSKAYKLVRGLGILRRKITLNP